MEWFSYLLKVSACTALFFLLYHFLLTKFTFFSLNRWYLIGTLLLSFIIPAVTIEVNSEIYSQAPILQQNEIGISDGAINELDPEVNFNDSSSINSYQLNDFLMGLYLFVTTIFILKLLIGVVKIFWIAKKYRTNKDSNYILVPSDNQFKNSSFYKYLFIDENLSLEDKEQVIKHEQIHIQKLHFVDKLFANLSVCVLWFNPFSYAYLNAIDANQEFEADAISTLATDKSAYANLILNLSQNSNQLIINQFSKLPLKRRMTMLFKNPTIPMKKLIYLSVVPILIICCIAFVGKRELITVKANKINKHKVVTDNSQTLNSDSLLGKTITGEIVELKAKKFPYNTLLETNNTTLSVALSPEVVNKLQLGDKISLKVSGYLTNVKRYDVKNNLTSELNVPTYTAETVSNDKGDVIWFRAKQAFLYELNQVRFANSKIDEIERNLNDEIQRVILFDGEFKIALDLAGLKLKSENFKLGDSVFARFIDEKLTDKKYYQTSNMVSLINKTNNATLINSNLYPKFYSKDGKQIQKSSQIDTKPILRDNQHVEVDIAGWDNLLKGNNASKTLVIDAGHGGKDNASKSLTGLREKNMNLRVALILKEEAEKRNIKVLMTREKDEFLSLSDRVNLQAGANAFISIHHNAMPMKGNSPISNNGFRGIELYYSKESKALKSKDLGLNILKSLKYISDFPVRDSLKSQNLFVTREAKVPSVVIEMGNMSYQDSFDFINEEKNIRRICNLILDGYVGFLNC